MRSKNLRAKNDLQSYQVKCGEIKQQYELSLTRLDEAKHEIDVCKERYLAKTQQMQQEKIAAVQAAQDEIRLAAESQFASAQQTFVKLKQDFTASHKERTILQAQCDELAAKVQSKEREQ
mmetsp:Transcript_7617/g.11158  ORF Transcript_7617/g.11158 Transcript_7617/m.11158 type:complete len:120 (-) Transcript_7617:12-371(-)